MPIDYKQYPKDWKTRIRPAILKRANDCCEFCAVKNRDFILRGTVNGKECYQDMNGKIYNAKDSEYIGSAYWGDINDTTRPITVVLTIAHLDHDINNNDYSNLKALCQKCHLNYDKEHHSKNSRQTRNAKKGLTELF